MSRRRLVPLHQTPNASQHHSITTGGTPRPKVDGTCFQSAQKHKSSWLQPPKESYRTFRGSPLAGAVVCVCGRIGQGQVAVVASSDCELSLANLHCPSFPRGVPLDKLVEPRLPLSSARLSPTSSTHRPTASIGNEEVPKTKPNRKALLAVFCRTLSKTREALTFGIN